MNILFAGTPAFAAAALDALLQAGHQVPLVLTQPDRPAGRGLKPQASAVKQLALSKGLAVAQPVTLKDAAVIAQLAAVNADVMVVAAYGLILPQPVLDLPRLGCLNIHASLLPRWRGAAPVQRAILAGDATTGVMVMQMEAGLDTGPVRATTEIEIGYKTTGMLTSELAELGAELMVRVLSDLDAHPCVPQPDDGVTYAAKIDKAESRIDFTRPSVEIERQVRAFAPGPGAFFEYQGERFRILAAECLESNGRAGNRPQEPHPRTPALS